MTPGDGDIQSVEPDADAPAPPLPLTVRPATGEGWITGMEAGTTWLLVRPRDSMAVWAGGGGGCGCGCWWE